MNVLLVQPHYNFPVTYTECPAGSLILLGTMAENAGHKVKILHLDADSVDLKQEIRVFKPDIVGVTVDTFHTLSAKNVLATAKDMSKDIYTVVGGAHPSALRQPFPNADAVVYGEGEFAFMDILEGKPQPRNCLMNGSKPSTSSWPSGVPPLGPRYSPPLHTVYSPSLDHIPLPNYDLIDMPRFGRFSGYVLNGEKPLFYIMASRGCPYSCTFCGSNAIWGRTVRLRKPEKIIEEMEYLIDKYGAREIFFQDDTLNISLPWAMEIFNLIIERGLQEKCISRIVCRADEKLITKEFLELARAAGVWLIFYGVESGNQEMVDSMNKGLKLEDVKRAFKLTKEVGIKIQASFVLGMPGETRETVEDTKQFIRETQPEYFGITMVTPLPGTVLEKQLKESGHLLNTDYDNYAMGLALVRTDELSRAELSKLGAGCNSLASPIQVCLQKETNHDS